ncbi:hypothetical protein RU98_GL001661 [Enterococcus caccae]|nr:hypothetical protein RU98_GL001661 [Enterococcus caccae]
MRIILDEKQIILKRIFFLLAKRKKIMKMNRKRACNKTKSSFCCTLSL